MGHTYEKSLYWFCKIKVSWFSGGGGDYFSLDKEQKCNYILILVYLKGLSFYLFNDSRFCIAPFKYNEHIKTAF